MLAFRTSFCLASLCTLALAKPLTPRSLQLKESLASAPIGFTHAGPADENHVLSLRLGLATANVDALIDTLYDVSTPSSPNYGKHLSRAEAASLLSPSNETVSAVNTWLSENGLNATTLNNPGDWLSLDISVARANELFGAHFSVFTHDTTGAESIRTLSYSIPSDLVGHLDVVHPTTSFTTASSPKLPLQAQEYNGTLEKRADACSSYIDPACLQQIYGLPTSAMKNQHPLVVTGYGDQWPSPSDMSSFLKQFRPDVDSSQVWSTWGIDNGTYNPDSPGAEAQLDVEYTLGVATNAEVYFLSVGNTAQDGMYGFLDTANAVLDSWSDAYVITTSYGQDEHYFSKDVVDKLCNAYAALGTAGVSVLFASGDGGVGGSGSGSCTDFVPTLPSDCPYVTSVGGTTGTNPETGAGLSGGGFSNLYSTPDFQKDAVTSYLSGIGSEYSGKYNSSGRGFPDVAAQATNVIIAWKGGNYLIGGTSAASPIFAATIALLNDELLSAGKQRLGWLNPFLYAHPEAFNDITSGTNPGCNTDGFSATSGWDPVTGLGSPNYSKLKTAAGI